jgi:hypothetical protein
MKNIFLKLTFLLTFSLPLFTSCTGNKLTNPNVEKGGLVVNPGEKLTVDLQDVVGLNIQTYKVTLKSIAPDFSKAQPLYDLTDFSKQQLAASSDTMFQFVMPKSVSASKPFLIVVDYPEQNTQLIDVVYENQFYVRPGIASTMAYNLLKFYATTDSGGNINAVKKLNEYTGTDFSDIKNLIQAKIDLMLANSEHLSIATTEYKKLTRYFMNGIAFNIDFLNAIKNYGIVYDWTEATPNGLLASNTPEGSLDHYKFAKDFKINGELASMNPLNHVNSPSQMMPGVSDPTPGTGIYIQEGRSVNITAQSFDIDDDFVDKDFIIQYVPRVLPSAVVNIVIPEPTPSYEVKTNLNNPLNTDQYTSPTITYNEALDLGYYTIDGDTAYRNVYYLMTDGMVTIPYRWNFKYADINRQPKIVTDANGNINDTSFDGDGTPAHPGLIIASDLVSSSGPSTWRQHASHCETDPNALYTNPATGAVSYYQAIHERADGPWSCAFKVTDDDLDQDPNAAPDIFNYTVANLDPYVQVMSGDPTFASLTPKKFIWPPVLPYTISNPKRVQSKTLPTCVTPDGATHFKCGLGLVQVTIDNGVKVAAETQSDLQFPYDFLVYDRDQTGGLSTSHSITRKIEFIPIPPRVVNYEVPSPDVNLAHPSTLVQQLDSNNVPMVDGGGNPIMMVAPLNMPPVIVGGNKVYKRWDTYLSDVLPQADPFQLLGQDITKIGFDDVTMAGTSARARAFLQGTQTPISGYLTQPHKTSTSFTMCFDSNDPACLANAGIPTGATTGAVTWLGHSLTSSDSITYSAPREYDSTCLMTSNNQDLTHPTDPWDQTTVGSEGWVFELNAIDYDNIGLRVGEPADPVYFQISQDTQSILNATGFMFCNYNKPNRDPLTFETYQALPESLPPKAAVDAEACVWQANAPTVMQPMPIYFQVIDTSGQLTVKKNIYHRIRMKWQPTDQGNLPLSKTYTPPLGYLQNVLAGLNLYGNRLLIKGDTLDQTQPPIQLNLFAHHKDMLPCINNGTGNEQMSSSKQGTFMDWKPQVKDQNRTMGSTGMVGSLLGRYEAEATLAGNRTITDKEFQKFMLYTRDCTIKDTSFPVDPLNAANPPSQTVTHFPHVYYTRSDDANNTPRIRIESASVDDLTFTPRPLFSNMGEVCVAHQYNPIKNSLNQPYNEVIIIQNNNTSNSYVLDLATNVPGCTGQSSIVVNPDQKYLAIASVCGASHIVNQVLWNDADSSGMVSSRFDVTDFGFPAGTQLSMKLFPQFYGADKVSIGSPTSTNLDKDNYIGYHIMPFDTFKIDPVSQLPSYTGYGNWLSSSDSSNLGKNPVSTGFPAYSVQYIDFDVQPNYMALATPTPNATLPGANVFYRQAPGDASRLQMFIKNHAAGSFPIVSSDQPIAANLVEQDPYDIKQFTLDPPAVVPASTPTFTGIGRTTCLDAPTLYPALSTLNYTSLKNFNQCTFSWQPSASGVDDGRKYYYQFNVQDNYNAIGTIMGEGAKHPAADPFTGVWYDSNAKTNGPLLSFNIDIESLESNTAPFFTTTNGGATINASYLPAGGAAGWTTVFPSSVPASGIQPGFSGCTGLPTGMSCSLTVSAGDTLQSATPVSLTEGTGQSFVVYSKDTNVTNQLKAITAVKPTQVLIVDGTYMGKTYNVPSFASMTMSASQTANANSILPGYATFSFSWTPTDAEANYLSNAGGFLIPLKVTDQQYAPASDPSFPSQFVTPAMNSTVWIWAKLTVKNNTPVVYYMNGATEVPLNSATLTMQTGSATSFTIRVKDSDVARWTQGGIYTGYSPSFNGFVGNSGSAFITAAPAGTPYYTAPSIYQNFVITGNPTNADIGQYASPSVTATDPGDQSRGLAQFPDAAVPYPNARVSNFGNSLNVPFNISVIGKPMFNVPNALPNPAGSQVYAYSSKPFYYPISLSISRPSELQKNFFIGIDSSTTVTPLKTTNLGTGIFINEKYVLKWLTSNFTNILSPPNRAIPIFAVIGTDCNVGSPVAKTLIRYNETSGQMETCKISTANLTANAVSQTLNLILIDGSLQPTIPSITQTSVNRPYTTAVMPSPLASALDQQFADFKQRCVNCNVAPVTSNASPAGSGLLMNASSTSGYVQYTFNSYESKLTYSTSPTFDIQKSYKDLTPSSVRNLNLVATKGETLTFNATLSAFNASNPQHYRWYVNGCLKSAGLLSSTSVSFSYLLNSLSSGANNDCTGEYGFTETGASTLGKVVVRLSIVNSAEIPGTASDASTSSYVYNVNVLNTDPNIQTLATYTPANPVVMNTTYITGNQNVQFSMPVTYGGKNYFAYTDLSTTAGLKVKLREFSANGDLPAGGSSLTLNCDPTFNSQPVSLGLHPHPDGKLYVAASNNNSYPTGTSASLTYGIKSATCFTNALTVAAPTQSFVAYGGGGSNVPAGYLGFSKFTQATTPTSMYSTLGTSLYQTGNPSDVSFYMMDGIKASYSHWSYSMSSVYGASAQPEFVTPFASNFVRRNIVSGNKLFQLIGAPANNTTGWRGFIIGSTVAPGTLNQLSATRKSRIAYADPSSSPAPIANDCQFNGTPLDGVYSAVDDSLYVVSYAADATGKGHFVQINNASSTTPSCTVIADTLNPSLNTTDQNPNISKMAFDSNNGMIYGVINQGTGLSGQLISYDIYTKKFVSRDLSASIASYEVIFSQAINGLFIFDNRKVGGTPTLYKVW